MNGSDTRADLVQLSRSVPRDAIGLMSVGGFLLAVAGLVGLIGAVTGPDALVDWRVAGVCFTTGVALAVGAGLVIERRFRARAAAAGFNAEQIREIEDEAERLNEEED